MAEQSFSKSSLNEEPIGNPQAVELGEQSYTLNADDEKELAALRAERIALEQRLGKLDRSTNLDGLREHFPQGTGGNRRSGGWQNRKRFDASFDKAKKLEPLYRRHLQLLAQEQSLLTGKRAVIREREAAQQKECLENAERVRNAHIGDYVDDSAYGVVRVVRVNKQSLTVETETHRREARKFSLILRMAFTREEIIEWFVKRDASEDFPIRACVREVLAGGKSIEEVASWLKDETYTRYPLLIRNLPWQQIIRLFYEDECQRLAKQVRQCGRSMEWVTEDHDQMYAWEEPVVDWLLLYYPSAAVSSPLDAVSVKKALSECDTLLLRSRKRS